MYLFGYLIPYQIQGRVDRSVPRKIPITYCSTDLNVDLLSIFTSTIHITQVPHSLDSEFKCRGRKRSIHLYGVSFLSALQLSWPRDHGQSALLESPRDFMMTVI